jgi:hypothetical protein
MRNLLPTALGIVNFRIIQKRKLPLLQTKVQWTVSNARYDLREFELELELGRVMAEKK